MARRTRERAAPGHPVPSRAGCNTVPWGAATGAAGDVDAAAAAAEAGWIEARDPVPGSNEFTVAAISVRDASPARERLGECPVRCRPFPPT